LFGTFAPLIWPREASKERSVENQKLNMWLSALNWWAAFFMS
jgi:hypothetical protein